MVMKRNMMRRNLRRSIVKSLGRYIAIVAIIALGASMFVGLLMTKSDMVATGKEYTDAQNMFDLRLISTCGWTQEQVDAVAQIDGVVDAEGLAYTDLMARLEDGQEEAEDAVYRFYAMPDRVNQLALRGGRWPQAANECLADGFHADDRLLGTTVTILENNTETGLDFMAYSTYTVVGYVATPLYMDMNRGTTSVGSGTLSSYFFVPPEGLNVDYFTEIHVTIPGDYDLYTKEYNDAMTAMADKITPIITPLAEARLEQLRTDAESAYRDGMKQYAEGMWAYWEGKEKAEKELSDAYQALVDGEAQIAENEQMIAEAEPLLEEAKAAISSGAAALAEGRQQFEESKATAYAPIDSAEEALNAGFSATEQKLREKESELAAVNEKLAELEDSANPQENEIAELTEKIAKLDIQIGAIDTGMKAAESALETLKLIPSVDPSIVTELESRLSSLKDQRSQLSAQRDTLTAQRDDLLAALDGPLSQRAELENQKRALESEISILTAALDGFRTGLAELDGARALLDEKFAAAEAELLAGERQLASARWQLSQKEKELADGKLALEQAKQDIADGWIEYENGKETAAEEFTKAEKELQSAKLQLSDARELIDSMTEVSVFVLDRNSNLGYNSLNSASDIVQGVSRVFPAFFLLVAALVCITTMTRMIDEERTQIGTLKALGYSNFAIISKYLLYAGSGAVVGCGLGVLVGSVVFPSILWQAYKIMLYITPNVLLRFNWTLCGIVVGAYTAVMLLVTWYCCRKALQEEPAELIRPKAPDPGKKILLERLPFWKKISFLNKVTIRNIFRYRQRLAMMIVGIGGCTALLVTGFGLRDSIVNVVSYQFEDVTTYDLSVYFEDGQSLEEQAAFLEKTAPRSEKAMFYHQSSVELDFDNQVKEIYLIAGGHQLTDFIDLHSGETALSMPGKNEVLLSIGAAEAMGIAVGDPVTLRNSDMQVLELTVSGIYDNHVYNYAIILPETMESQWGTPAQMQMAFLSLGENQDPYVLSTMITSLHDVVNVSVSEETASMVGRMMEALDLVVVVVVVCAGLLAAIVLYNLTNININERIREIATIKVLGFNAGETGAYVFKENLALSAIGAVVGLFLGKLLLIFVMSQIKIDLVWFKAMVLPGSYLWAVGLTMLSACLVDFIFYFKLDKINMAEALKSVE